jgi:hypothetical protein
VNIDVTVYLNGYHGDTSRTFFVGKPSPNAKRLVDANEEALQEAIKVWLRLQLCQCTAALLISGTALQAQGCCLPRHWCLRCHCRWHCLGLLVRLWDMVWRHTDRMLVCYRSAPLVCLSTKLARCVRKWRRSTS